MAKELPYFKFEPNQWENGNIQMFPHELKGVFMDLCSMYWSRLGELPYKLAIGKICNGNATALDSLYEEKIFDIKDGFVCIDFLNEQLEEFENVSKKNSDNARNGWEKRRKNATAKRPQSELNAIREEKRREDNVKEKYTHEQKLDWFKQQVKETKIFNSGKYPDKMFIHFTEYWTAKKPNGTKMAYEMQKTFSFQARLMTWVNNDNEYKKL